MDDGGYSYRIDFRFVSPSGDHLRSQTWALFHAPDDPPQVLLLQAKAKLAAKHTTLEELRPNYVALSIVVTTLEGPLHRWVFSDRHAETLTDRMAAFPLTLAIAKGPAGLDISLFTANLPT
jgi:hypothetical protein